MGIHGDDQFRIGGIQNFLTNTPAFAADDHSHGRKVAFSQVLCPRGQSCNTHRNPPITERLPSSFPGGLHHRNPEYGAHTGPDHLMAVGIRAALQQRHRNIQRIRSPKYGSQISRILNAAVAATIVMWQMTQL